MLDARVRNLAASTGIPFSQAIACATVRAAQALGGEVARMKGVLRPGMHADLVVWDLANERVMRTVVAGRTVFRA